MEFIGSLEENTINQVISYLLITIKSKLSILETIINENENNIHQSPQSPLFSKNSIGSPTPLMDRTTSFSGLLSKSTLNSSFTKPTKRIHNFVDNSIKSINLSKYIEDDGKIETNFLKD